MDQEEVKKLQNGLWYLQEHFRLLKMGVSRPGTRQELVDSVTLASRQFDDIAKILPPKKKEG